MRIRLRLLSVIVAASVSFGSFHFTSNAQNQRTAQVDLLILHGKVIDGSGKGARKADVGIRGDRIVFVGDAKKAKIEATHDRCDWIDRRAGIHRSTYAHACGTFPILNANRTKLT